MMQRMREQGFSLVEVLFSLSIALILLAAGYHSYVTVQRQRLSAHQRGELRLTETAAMQAIGHWLRHASDFALLRFAPPIHLPAAMANDSCHIPQLPLQFNSERMPVPIQALNVSKDVTAMGCLGSVTHPLVGGSSILVIHAISGPSQHHLSQAISWSVKSGKAGDVHYWAYQPQWLFIVKDGQTTGLMHLYRDIQGIKGAKQGIFIRGVEKMLMKFAICSPNGLRWRTLQAMRPDDWTQVQLVQLGLLVRARNKAANYTNQRIYQLAGTKVGPFNDHYRRVAENRLIALSSETSLCVIDTKVVSS
ncbi:PilW family protein [Celerinatantimonas yamalensis]|uniref:PilW family protein n=1 Tax=Celerinatantimonas yamalensis TaxID=559956 RepID=A0ABW9G9X9_9GAMM